jgi:hypothetical protein
VSVPSSTGGEVCLRHMLKMEPTQCSETPAFNTQTPDKYPEDNSSLQQGESLKSRKDRKCPHREIHPAHSREHIDQ